MNKFDAEFIAEQRAIIDEYHRIAVPGGDKNKAAIAEAAMMSAAWNNYSAALDEIERLRVALAPFARLAKLIPARNVGAKKWEEFNAACMNIQSDDLRRAAEFLEDNAGE